MKSLILFIFLIISTESINLRILKEQEFVNYGTGLKNVPTQNRIEGMKSGCCFLSACVVGGLGTVSKFKDARKWALSNNKIRNDNYVNMDKYLLARQISQRYNTVFHSNWKIVHGKGHFYVCNEHGREVFNSAGLGWGHQASIIIIYVLRFFKRFF